MPFAAFALIAVSQVPHPVPLPARPAPNWDWSTLGGTLAFHGANHSGVYTDTAVAALSKYVYFTRSASRHLHRAKANTTATARTS
jgi:hypothetical protein